MGRFLSDEKEFLSSFSFTFFIFYHFLSFSLLIYSKKEGIINIDNERMIKMLKHNRHKMIIDFVTEQKSVSIHDLCERFFMSESTARRDIAALCDANLLQRIYGGVAAASVSADRHTPFVVREQLHDEEKKVMGKKAADMVKNGDVIIMDGSTSALCIIPYLLSKKDLTIVTSSAKIAMAAGERNIKTFATGGQMLPGSFSFYGQDAEHMASRINADIMFFSCRGLSYDGMLTDRSIEENNVRKVMMGRAKKIVLLCDSSKFGKLYLHNLCHLSEIDDMITEDEIPPELKIHMKN